MSDDQRAEQAFELGRQYGTDRASWVFDGNTSEETYRTFLRGWEDGDPYILDAYDHGFSIGEWAGESSIELEIEGYEDEFLDGVDHGYWSELERVALYHTTEDNDD